MKDSLYTCSYAAALGVTCALLLTGIDHLTGPYKQANIRAERMLNILSVLQVPLPKDLSPQDVVKMFEANVSEEEIGTIHAYLYASSKTDSHSKAVAVPFEGAGLWGPIKGFLALNPDMKTIRGIGIYQQEETPGLGGEIAEPWFKEQFKGKFIIDSTGKPGISIKQASGTLAQNEVDAITGATLTCNKLEAMINEVLEQIAKEQIEHGQ